MNLKEDLTHMLAESDWTASRLSIESGVPAPVLTRFLRGTRKGLHSSTVEKIWPFVYGEKRPPHHPQEAA
ncbi:hypothetical protein [Maridesulfovibrio ferrireducens]|uniref:hypothetical protein n=1 Tax=Maridesulfovibrio ferrireducens TaxID=246191 RepID=UPI001A1AECEA|nr:hypothetical protein [Maridesulfovibrio ferrireducens]MBI9113294.1 hypothetical protein [Maridesulfovibrio ferrireducens]